MKWFLFLVGIFVLSVTISAQYVLTLPSDTSIEFGTLLPKDLTMTPGSRVDMSSPATSMYFVGDLMLARDVERHYKRNGVDYPFSGFSFATSSVVIANFEAAIPKMHVSSPNNTFRFSVDPVVLPALQTSGVTHVSLANNHSFDYGKEGYLNSLKALSDHNIVAFGHPALLATSSLTVFEQGGLRIGVVGIHTLLAVPSKDELRSFMEATASSSDVQIAYIHWGNEYESTPSSFQYDYSQILSDVGFDVVIGHHPHVVQSIEYVGNTLVFFSLGNYIFDQYFSPEVTEGLVLEAKVVSGGIDFSLIPIETSTTRTVPRVKTATSTADFFERILKISDEQLKASIASGSIKYRF